MSTAPLRWPRRVRVIRDRTGAFRVGSRDDQVVVPRESVGAIEHLIGHLHIEDVRDDHRAQRCLRIVAAVVVGSTSSMAASVLRSFGGIVRAAFSQKSSIG